MREVRGHRSDVTPDATHLWMTATAARRTSGSDPKNLSKIKTVKFAERANRSKTAALDVAWPSWPCWADTGKMPVLPDSAWHGHPGHAGPTRARWPVPPVFTVSFLDNS